MVLSMFLHKYDEGFDKLVASEYFFSRKINGTKDVQ
jgi:hypothetical protein